MRPIHRSLVWLWIAGALLLIHARGLELALDAHPTDRLRFHAIPIALSSLYHGWPYDYTGIKAIALGFQQTASIDEAITSSLNYVPTSKEAVYYWAADDRGMSDYVAGAFLLFGPRTSSLYSFYFVVLGASCALFLLGAGGSAAAHAALVLFLGTFYGAISVIPLANLSPTAFEPVTLYEPRTIELLCYVAMLHLALSVVDDRSWTMARVALAGAQAALLTWCVHARSSVQWEVAFVVAVGMVAVWANRRDRRAAVRALVPVALVALSLVGLAVYQRATFHPRYFEDKGARTFWHNALMGVNVGDASGRRVQLGISDSEVIDAVIGHLRDTQDPRLSDAWTVDAALNSLGSHSEFDWATYERAARDLYWRIWREHTGDMLHWYGVVKPEAIRGSFVSAWRSDTMEQQDLQQISFNPLAPGALLIALPGWLLAAFYRPRLGRLALATVALLGCSLVPAWLFYAVPLTMMGAFVTLGLLGYLTFGAVLAALSRAVVRPRPEPLNVGSTPQTSAPC